jgi:5-methyltetrahydrofolate--homocysteine methyltransferase
LLVKSTLEMKYVVQDLQHQKLEFPVICGGAALTRKYVEDDLRREYAGGVFYADDAFAGLHFMERLSSANGERTACIEEGRTIKEFVKKSADGGDAVAATKPSIEIPAPPNIPKPAFWGIRVLKPQDFDLREIFPYINETALFKNQWQLKTASQEDYARLVETKYRPILKELQEEVIASGCFEPKVVYGYFGAQSEGNDTIVYDLPEGWKQGDPVPTEKLRFTFPRQTAPDSRHLSISDYFLPKAGGQMDVIAFTCVTIGARASHETQKLFEGGEYTKYLYLHGLSVETAEALAEITHKRVREELGMAGDDAPKVSDLFHQKYRGSRYSPGYPACPDLEDQTKFFELLHPDQTIGVHLTTGFLLDPEQSTSALVVHHPAAKYFVV